MDSRLGLPQHTLLDDSYRIRRVIGSGGFGITYEAEDVRLRTTVAVKEYYPAGFGNRDATMSVRPRSDADRKTFEWGRSRFLKEAQTLARFSHPSIVRVTRVFQAKSTAYMVMDFAQGQPLEAWLKRLGRPPTQEELDRIAAPLLDALETLHAEKFLHRDIAPDNIIIRPDGTPVLLDFGAARQAVAEVSRALTGIVKAGYSPHEQYAADGRLQGPWSDLYALGATLYRAVTGQPPEESTLRVSDDRMLPAARIAKGTYRSSFLLAIDVCLKVTPTERPQSVPQLRPLLLGQSRPQIAGTRKIEAAPPNSSARRWIAAVAVLAVMCGAFGGFEYARRSAQQLAGLQEEAQRQADAAMAQKRADDEAEVKRQEEQSVKEQRAAEAQLRARAEVKRQADEAAASRKAEEERRAQAGPGTEPAKSAAPILPPQPVPPPRVVNPVLQRCNGDGVVALVGGQRRCLKPRESFKDCDACPEMVVVPSGSFQMGSDLENPDEKPVHKVTIGRPFAVGKFEVTFADWDACSSEGGCPYRPTDRGWGRGQRPAIGISWDDATQQYLPWLSRKTGNVYRLLTEAEWEYAARAGSKTKYSFGNTITTQQAQYSEGASGSAAGTVEVGSFKPNAFGLYDVHGNVWEWVEDCWHDTYAGAPSNGDAWTTSCSGETRHIRRGGSFYNVPKFQTSAVRAKNSPSDRLTFGFRAARSL